LTNGVDLCAKFIGKLQLICKLPKITLYTIGKNIKSSLTLFKKIVFWSSMSRVIAI